MCSGLALGTDVNGKNDAIAMTIALIFHQMLEGIALGSTMVMSNFTRLHAVVMVTAYALTTPVAIAIGIVVSDTYEPESTAALATQGTLDAISGGLLLYASLVFLVVPDFLMADLRNSGGFRMHLAMNGALFLGAALMAIIAMWA